MSTPQGAVRPEDGGTTTFGENPESLRRRIESSAVYAMAPREVQLALTEVFAQLREARKDSARLDWMEKMPSPVWLNERTEGGYKTWPIFDAKDIRSALDRAMFGTPPTESSDA